MPTSTNNNLTIEELSPGVLHIQTEFQYELTSMFMRLQEFYESPYTHIRGKYFTHEQYMDTCAVGSKRTGGDSVKFTYLEDWNGFNVPGNVFNKWVKLFSKDYLWDKEQQLVDLVYSHEAASRRNTKFYVIGTNHESDVEGGDTDHELSHAWWYLDPSYKRKMLKLVNSLSSTAYSDMTKHLAEAGYTSSVFKDEIAAYLSTNQMTETVDMFPEGRRIPWAVIADFQILFAETKEEKLSDDEDS